MNLLLLLSALLSALTGTGASARATPPAVAVSQVAGTTAATRVAAGRGVRPEPARATTVAVRAIAGAAWALAPAVPLFLSRRRE